LTIRIGDALCKDNAAGAAFIDSAARFHYVIR
jgi:hypothetical protein